MDLKNANKRKGIKSLVHKHIISNKKAVDNVNDHLIFKQISVFELVI